MRSLIYFPGFEPSDINWLKFALLYLDKVEPIVPESGDAQLSDLFLDLLRYTDLIDLYRPRHDEGHRATADAIEQIERILRNPSLFSGVFGTDRIDAEWRRPDPSPVELWGEKFSYNWERFCFEHGFAKESSHGILIPRSLSNVYMSILANCIADSRGVSSISDDASINNLSLFVRRSDSGALDQQLSLLETAFPILLPENLSEVDIVKIMQLRNSEGFRKKRRAFQDVVQRMADAVENGDDDASVKEELGSSFQDFSDEIALLGIGVATVGFNTWLVARDADPDALNAMRQILAGTAFVVGGVITVRKMWTNTHVKRLARRYVLDVRSLGPNSNSV